jgi:hypothetical protein
MNKTSKTSPETRSYLLPSRNYDTLPSGALLLWSNKGLCEGEDSVLGKGRALETDVRRKRHHDGDATGA